MNEMIARALVFAAFKHRHQRRKGSDDIPYINHPLDLLAILSVEAGIDDADLLCAALLHDTVEDTDTSPQEILAAFNPAIAALVAEVTDDKTLPKARRKALQIEHAPHGSEKARMLKLADKIANVRDMAHTPPKHWPPERRLAYLDWSVQVVAGLRGTHAGLEASFDAALASTRAVVEKSLMASL